MMHEHEKSDPEIVAMKPANKAVPTAAELVERRAGTKGNAGQQSTLRAQDRAGVSQALDRIRQAARHNKKERFTALLHHVNPETLRLAFDALKKDAAPGVDGTTWTDYEVDLERRLEELHDRVLAEAGPAPPALMNSKAAPNVASTLTRRFPGGDRRL